MGVQVALRGFISLGFTSRGEIAGSRVVLCLIPIFHDGSTSLYPPAVCMHCLSSTLRPPLPLVTFWVQRQPETVPESFDLHLLDS